MMWDRQVLMPPGGGPARTAHVGRLSRMAHTLFTAQETHDLLEKAKSDANSEDELATIRVVTRDLRVQDALSTDMVERKSKVSSDAYDAWRVARTTSDFKKLEPYLVELFDIARETAESLGYKEHIYDALIDLFEEGTTTAAAQKMFDEIKEPSKAIMRMLDERGQVDASFLEGAWDQEALRAFSQDVADAIGFDFSRGRLDITTNAFCTNLSANDVRMTARPSASLNGIVFSSMHEMGHGLYEQGMPSTWERTPLIGGISNGVHESQSRTWENIVARSFGFWKRFLPDLQRHLPALSGVDSDRITRAVNHVEPGPIRIGSDELTYNLHILIRFELECDLVSGKVAVKDLPEAWIAKYKSYLGITPKNDGEGVLQDVHWSRGMVGYFPTYSMGNMMSWQIWHTLEKDVPNTDDLMAAGNFKPILGWLQDKIYSQGKRFTPRDLITRVTGRPMESKDYVLGMQRKFEQIAAK